ncbi:MAG: branched-chain amino acid ABC transporter permease [Alphaproteobacteria bacterium]|nr:branched-chain amino acid ABC transporter permease [Alphaproteobacteria bacterium]MCW5744104.1 branched-chain amino acid ABC transporter permease [Alphaproteobacteria bacterium]
MTSLQDTASKPDALSRPAAASARDPMIWAFLAALVLLFWLPELILYMGWARFWIQFTTQVFIWSLFAMAFNLLMGYTGMVSFGQAAYLGIGGYTAGLLLKNIPGLSFYLGLAAAPVGGALAALIIGWFCVRRTHIYFAILTLAFGHIVYLIVFKWYDFTGGDNGLIGIPVPKWITEPTFANYYKFVLVIVVAAIYLLWRIVNSPFGKALTAIRENPERADFIGIPVDRYRLYAFVIVGAFSGLAGALIMVNERSVYPDLAHWTQSTQVLLMVLLGGIYTFFGPIVGALLLRTMDADITQNYPEIWQLFLGGVLVLILFGLPGGIVGFIQGRDISAGDDPATRRAKSLRVLARKTSMFFAGAVLFTAFFAVLQQPEAWLEPRARNWSIWAPVTWGVVPCALVQLALFGGALWLLLRRAERFVLRDAVLLVALPVLFLALHAYLQTPLSGMLIALLWVIHTIHALAQPDLRRAFAKG